MNSDESFLCHQLWQPYWRYSGLYYTAFLMNASEMRRILHSSQENKGLTQTKGLYKSLI